MREKIEEAPEKIWYNHFNKSLSSFVCKQLDDDTEYIRSDKVESDLDDRKNAINILDESYIKEISRNKTKYDNLFIEYEDLETKLQIAIDELRVVAEWKDAYPEDVFPPIGTDTYHIMCKASGISVDRVSAHVLRKIVIAYSEAAEKVIDKINKP